LLLQHLTIKAGPEYIRIPKADLSAMDAAGSS